MAKVYSVARVSGMDRVLRDSSWRRRRLLFLCWHGIALNDEDLWDPGLYISPQLFRERLQTLAENNYNVLPLDDGLKRLEADDLPPRSVVITFDDGFYDFAVHAAPMLREFGFPATVYLTTYYVGKQLPVFNLMLQYMLWKNRSPNACLKDGRTFVTGVDARRLSDAIIREIPAEYTAEQKNGIARDIAHQIGFDFESVLSRRLLHLMNASEVKQLAAAGDITFEAHTHRHRTPPEASGMQRELEENNSSIEQLTGRRPLHFCYPSGNYRREYFRLLKDAGYRSATTCELGISSKSEHRYLLPRVLDSADLSAYQYEGWLSGAYAVRRLLA